MTIWTWLLTAVSLFGNYLNCRKKVACFFVWAVCNSLWCAYDIYFGALARAVLDVVQTAFCVYGVVEWTKRR